MPRIQTEIRVSDILAMYQSRADKFIFMCYAIANKLNEKHQFYPGGDHGFCTPYHWLNSVAGTGALSRQIDRQLKDFVYKLNPELRFWNTFGEFFIEYGGKTVAIYKSGMPINPMLIELATGNHSFRQQFLEFIVAMDPQAVFTVDIYTA